MTTDAGELASVGEVFSAVTGTVVAVRLGVRGVLAVTNEIEVIALPCWRSWFCIYLVAAGDVETLDELQAEGGRRTGFSREGGIADDEMQRLYWPLPG
jgi:hypothetical protein